MSSDDEYEIPLQDQRVFGAGIKRKRVKFVPSSSTATSSGTTSNSSARSVGDFYLSLVFSKESKSTGEVGSESASSLEAEGVTFEGEEAQQSETCEVCNLPFSPTPTPLQATQDTAQPSTSRGRSSTPTAIAHEASLAHQVCLEHSHPPSHLDRNRKGLQYLSSYSWDPDSRLGLGASGQGIQYPIKSIPKDDKMGIGVVLPKDGEKVKKVKVGRLDAGKIKKLAKKDKKKDERLRDMFYRNDDVERYLGGGQ